MLTEETRKINIPEAGRMVLSIEIKLNGEKKMVKEGKTVEDMIQSLSLNPQRVMIMLNSELLPQTKYSYSLKEEDELEILPFFAAGG
ncbi:MAG: sulfur carrier protein ThiS [Candidatus Aminicenantes bacterium]|nr:MAG: sulfur carrier protein ThiS [Candidatus Aminicenantes bacterium]